MTGKQLFFKAEMFQKTGSFKVWKLDGTDLHHDLEQARGALNAIRSCLEQGETVARVVTHSSGNHGQVVTTMIVIKMMIKMMITMMIKIMATWSGSGLGVCGMFSPLHCCCS